MTHAVAKAPHSSSALSARMRQRQARVVALWFGAIGVTFVALVVFAGMTKAQTQSDEGALSLPTPGPSVKRLKPNLHPIRVKRDALPCAILPGNETGMLLVTIANSSNQVIQRNQTVYYELGRAAGEPLHGVRSPIVVPLGGQFSQLVPVQADLQAGACKAWIYEPLEALEYSE